MQGIEGGRRPLCRYPAVLPGAILLILAIVVAGVAALAADTPPAQSAREADLELQKLMAKRHAIRGFTARGQTLADAPPFKVLPRKPSISKFPCTNCHDNVFVDRRVRILKDEHTDLVFEHGGGRFWCYDACHNGRDMDHLVSLRRRPIDYDKPYELCGQCHFEKRKDWAFGGHGRRAGAWPAPRDVPLTHDKLLVVDRDKIAKWKGERLLLACPACHNPHSPSIKPYPPSPAPQVRAGLPPAPAVPEIEAPIWERDAAKVGGKR